MHPFLTFLTVTSLSLPLLSGDVIAAEEIAHDHHGYGLPRHQSQADRMIGTYYLSQCQMKQAKFWFD